VLVTNGNQEKVVKAGSLDERKLIEAIIETFKELAELLVADAEGATKLIKVKVSKAKNQIQAKSVAFTVAESPLVKTAMFGSDANWGRILSAVGRDKTVEDLNGLQIKLNGVPLVKNGHKDPKYSEKVASKAMKKKEITIEVVMGSGKHEFQVMTSDLSEDYVLITVTTEVNDEYLYLPLLKKLLLQLFFYLRSPKHPNLEADNVDCRMVCAHFFQNIRFALHTQGILHTSYFGNYTFV